MIRFVVVDDHQIVRDGLIALLGPQQGIAVVGTGASGQDAVRVGGSCGGRRGHGHPDARLVGIEATRFVTCRLEGVRAVMLT